MIPLVSKKSDINKFIDIKLPTKRMIFSRLGASAPGTHFSGDDPVRFGMKPTEQADAFATAAETYEPEKPSDDGAAD